MAKPSVAVKATTPRKTLRNDGTAGIPVGLPRQRRGKATIVRSDLAFQGHIFAVYTEEIQEPNGVHATRDVVRHNGSVVILAVDEETDPADPRIVLEQQYRQAAREYLLELPAGRIDPGEKALPAAKRELIEETGFRAKKWTSLVRYFATPGFVGEAMTIFLATGIVAGEAHPEEDEKIDVCLVPLSVMVELCMQGKIHDGKTVIGVMLYAEQRRRSAAKSKAAVAAAKKAAKVSPLK